MSGFNLARRSGVWRAEEESIPGLAAFATREAAQLECERLNDIERRAAENGGGWGVVGILTGGRTMRPQWPLVPPGPYATEAEAQRFADLMNAHGDDEPRRFFVLDGAVRLTDPGIVATLCELVASGTADFYLGARDMSVRDSRFACLVTISRGEGETAFEALAPSRHCAETHEVAPYEAMQRALMAYLVSK